MQIRWKVGRGWFCGISNRCPGWPSLADQVEGKGEASGILSHRSSVYGAAAHLILEYNSCIRFPMFHQFRRGSGGGCCSRRFSRGDMQERNQQNNSGLAEAVCSPSAGIVTGKGTYHAGGFAGKAYSGDLRRAEVVWRSLESGRNLCGFSIISDLLSVVNAYIPIITAAVSILRQVYRIRRKTKRQTAILGKCRRLIGCESKVQVSTNFRSGWIGSTQRLVPPKRAGKQPNNAPSYFLMQAARICGAHRNMPVDASDLWISKCSFS